MTTDYERGYDVGYCEGYADGLEDGDFGEGFLDDEDLEDDD